MGARTVNDASVMSLRLHRAREAFELMIMGAIVGLFAGLAGVALNLSVHLIELLRHDLDSWFLVLCLPCLGAVAGLWIQRRLFRDYSGHGVPDVIRSVSTGRGYLPRRMVFSRLISSCLTVGCGGAAGLEGPIVVSGAAVGSTVARLFRIPEERRALLIACGTSGAIAGIFNAPLTGLIFSLEVILGEWKSKNLVPTVTAAAVATQISRSLMGNKIPFPGDQILHQFQDLPAFAILGLVCAVAGVVFARLLDLTGSFFSRVRLPDYLVPGVGGLGVGVVALFCPQAIGEGYAEIRHFLSGDPSLSMAVVGLILTMRYITTALTLGSGGAGGVFAPCLIIGSASGLLFGHLIQAVDPSQSFSQPSAYALVGMAGMVAAIMSAPLTGMFLVLEICGSYELILPLMLCSLVAMFAYRLLGQDSVYVSDLIRSGSYRQRGSQEQLLACLEWDELIQPCPTLNSHMTLGDFVHQHGRNNQVVFGVVDEGDAFQGLVFFDDLRPHLFDTALYPLVTLSSIADRGLPSVTTTQRPDRAWEAFGETKRDALAVLSPHGRFLGVVTKPALLDAVRRELGVHAER